MKTIDIKSLLIGALTALLIITLTSGKPNDNNALKFVPSATGMGIYNEQTNILYLYRAWNRVKIDDTPIQVFKVAEDGASLTEIKEK